MFKRILVANRGEIAVRVMRSCRELGISPLAVYSEADARALHVRLADRAVEIGPAPARESYLVVEKILDAAKRMGADAIHPGYGFLAENAEFAEACAAAGIVFIGPSPSAIRAMGDKMIARGHMSRAGVPVVPGAHGSDDGFPDAESALVAAREIGLPVMLKATAGGGGKGMRLVRDEARFVASFNAARREAEAAFGNGAVYVEKFIENPRHVEIQVMADGAGHAVHLFERDCSVQRRHQKVIEETPSPVVDDATRARMGEVAVKAALAVDYRGAGTIELLYGGGDFYFLEMNTRLQVEHPVTELCTGVDLVRQQILVADGQPMTLRQETIAPRGAAIECRLYAEDPIRFLPSPGDITVLELPSGPGVRVDAGVYPGASVPPDYDPLLAKICVWAEDRALAIARMRRALTETRVLGIMTNLDFHRRVLEHPAFISGDYDTGFIAAHQDLLAPKPAPADPIAIAAAAIDARHRVVSRRNGASTTSGSAGAAWRGRGRWRR